MNQTQRRGEERVTLRDVGTEEEAPHAAENQLRSRRPRSRRSARLRLILPAAAPQTACPSGDDGDSDGDSCGSATAEARVCEHAAAVAAVPAHVRTTSQGQLPARPGSHRQAAARALHESVSPLGPRRWPAGVTQSHIYAGSAPHHFANTLLVTYQTTRGPRLHRQASPLPPIR